MPHTHVAILLRPYIEMILAGRKTVESRLTVHPLAPYRQVAVGEQIYFKASGGPYLATARVARVEFYERLTPARVEALRRQYNDQIGGAAEYWRWKRHSRYGTLIWLAQVAPVTQGPRLAPSRGLAWFVLPAIVDTVASGPTGAATPMTPAPEKPQTTPVPLTVRLTAGAIRNQYLRVPGSIKGNVTLVLPNDTRLTTAVTPKGIFRKRGWGAWYQRWGLRAGAVITFVPAGAGTYEIRLPSEFGRGMQDHPALKGTASGVHANDVSPPRLRDYITKAKLTQLIRLAMEEDLGPRRDDVTSRLMIAKDEPGTAVLRSRQAGRLAGVALLPAIAWMYDRNIKVETLLHDGAELHPGAVVARFRGPLRSILGMERVALNFCTHLSGIATLTARYVALAMGTKARLCDTRKTIPGLRELAKYAVVCGGGVSHRMGLYDAMLVKDNHLARYMAAAPGTGAGVPGAVTIKGRHAATDLSALAAALRRVIAVARREKPPLKFIEVEVDNLDQLRVVLPCEPDMVLLDNMAPPMLRKAVALRNQLAPAVQLEASGGVNLHTVAAIARSGVERISVGAITHSAPTLDLGLDID